MRHKLLAAAFAILSATVAAQQSRDTSGAAPPRAGTGSIRGQVVSDDSTPRPVRRAIVTISGDLPASRSAITDDEGRFVFGNLATGRFTIAAKKAAFLPGAYGARRPGRPGTPVVLTADQQATIVIRLARGAVLTGIVSDLGGRPIVGAQVSADKARTSSDSNPTVGTAMTDDRGRYRIYGLMPGDYVVAAKPTAAGSGAIGLRRATEIDAALAELARRSNASSNLAAPVSPANPPFPESPSVAFPASYFPGTPLLQEAQSITVVAGEVRDGVDIRVVPIRSANVEGTISGVQNLDAVQFSILRVGQRSASSSDFNPALTIRPSGSDGQFKYTNVTPGRYTIMARADRNQPANAPPPSGRIGAGGGGLVSMPVASGAGNDYVYAFAEVDVRGEDITGLSLVLQPGNTMSGRIGFDRESPPVGLDLTKIRVSLSASGSGSFMLQTGNTIIGNSFSSAPPATVTPDGAFTLTNIPPGTYILRGSMGPDAPAGWWIRSALAGGRDLLDGPIEVRPGLSTTSVALTLSDKHTEISGSLRTAAGAPASEYFVVAFSADRSLWGKAPRRIANTRPSTDGSFTLRDLPGGDYLIAALDDLEPADLNDARFLEEIVPAAVRVTLADGEKKKQDLTIAK